MSSLWARKSQLYFLDVVVFMPSVRQSELSFFSKPDIYVIDTETTGLKGYPYDHVVDVAVCRVSLQDGTVEEAFSMVVGHDVSGWDQATREAWIFENTDLSLEMVAEAPPAEDVATELRRLLRGCFCTSFNIDFDFRKFLLFPPWSLETVVKLTPCIMKRAMPICAIPGFYGQYKYPKLQEAYDMIVPGDPADIKGNQTHRALSDAIMASYLLITLDRRGQY
jgi:DNA polymerase-3 subunit epsilon